MTYRDQLEQLGEELAIVRAERDKLIAWRDGAAMCVCCGREHEDWRTKEEESEG